MNAFKSSKRSQYSAFQRGTGRRQEITVSLWSTTLRLHRHWQRLFEKVKSSFFWTKQQNMRMIIWYSLSKNTSNPLHRHKSLPRKAHWFLIRSLDSFSITFPVQNEPKHCDCAQRDSCTEFGVVSKYGNRWKMRWNETRIGTNSCYWSSTLIINHWPLTSDHLYHSQIVRNVQNVWKLQIAVRIAVYITSEFAKRTIWECDSVIDVLLQKSWLCDWYSDYW